MQNLNTQNLNTQNSYEDELYKAIKNGDRKDVEMLIKKGTDDLKNTALYFSAGRGNYEMSQFLIENGARVVMIHKFGYNALFASLTSGNNKLTELLVDTFEDIDKQDVFGQTILHYYASFKGCEITRILKKRADVNIQDSNGNTPLHIATIRSNRVCALFILDKGADINIQNHQGYTPLHIAASYGNMDFVLLLLEWSADFRIQNNHGETAEQIAKKKGHTTISRILLILTNLT